MQQQQQLQQQKTTNNNNRKVIKWKQVLKAVKRESMSYTLLYSIYYCIHIEQNLGEYASANMRINIGTTEFKGIYSYMLLCLYNILFQFYNVHSMIVTWWRWWMWFVYFVYELQLYWFYHLFVHRLLFDRNINIMTDIKRRYNVFDFELLLCVSKVGQCHIDPAMIFLFMRVDYQLYRNFRIFRSPNLAISSDSKVVPNIKSYVSRSLFNYIISFF